MVVLLTVSSEDVRVALSFESPTLYSEWHAKWNSSDKRVRVNMFGFDEGQVYASVNCGIFDVPRCVYRHSKNPAL